jgi:hypothetical protein
MQRKVVLVTVGRGAVLELDRVDSSRRELGQGVPEAILGHAHNPSALAAPFRKGARADNLDDVVVRELRHSVDPAFP